MKQIGRVFGLFVLVMLVCGCAGKSAERAAKGALGDARKGDRVVILISLDGLAHYYLDDPKAEMPTLRRMVKEGARAERMRASTPSVTWPNHATLMTGVHPARHGVIGNNYYDRKAGRRVTLIADPQYDKTEIVKVPTIYDLAKERGMKTAAVRWPASRNAGALDWQIPDVGNLILLTRYSTPGLLAECRAEGLFATGVAAASQPAATQVAATGAAGGKKAAAPRTPDDDWADAFNLILRRHRPALGLLHLANIDHEEHLFGPRSEQAYEAIREADAQVKRVIEEARRNYPGGVTVVVVSDHGFSPIGRQVLPNVVLRKAGLVEVKGNEIVGGPVRVVVQGGAALVYIVDRPNKAAVAKRVREAFAGVESMGRIVGPGELHTVGVAEPEKDPNAPDMVLFSAFGAVFGDTASGDLPFVDKPERRGSHGHDTSYPELHATFIAWGAGVRPGVKLGTIENTDVAPTVARLLGFEMKGVDGRVLGEVLAE